MNGHLSKKIRKLYKSQVYNLADTKMKEYVKNLDKVVEREKRKLWGKIKFWKKLFIVCLAFNILLIVYAFFVLKFVNYF